MFVYVDCQIKVLQSAYGNIELTFSKRLKFHPISWKTRQESKACQTSGNQNTVQMLSSLPTTHIQSPQTADVISARNVASNREQSIAK